MNESLQDAGRENVCPECGSKLITDNQRAEITCQRCGLVIDDNIIDFGPEWVAFDQEQRNNRSRVGAPMSNAIHDKGLTTVIDWKNKDSHGREISPKNRAQFYRLRKWQRKIRVSNSSERNLIFALSEIDRFSSLLGLSRNLREDSSLIYRKAANKNLVRGRSIDCVAAAAVYISCRRFNIPRTLDEISQVSKVSKKSIGRTYRFLARQLKIKLAPTSPADYVPRFASHIGLSNEVQSKAIEIINDAVNSGLTSGKGPIGLAGGALYLASLLVGERKTQKDVADVVGVTEVTIRNRYKELYEKLEICVPLIN